MNKVNHRICVAPMMDWTDRHCRYFTRLITRHSLLYTEMVTSAAQLGEQFGYDEINLNVWCPSERVRSGSFGACLMLEPTLVRGCVAAMKNAVNIPVTVKCRTGINKIIDYQFLKKFVQTIEIFQKRLGSIFWLFL